MKTRLLITVILTSLLISCEKENNDSIPNLLDNNPKVLKISSPGIGGFNDIVVNYQGDLISSITRPGDSIKFFYTNEQLDSARRYSICENGNFLDEQSVKFLKNNGKIIRANFKTIKFSNDTIQFRFVYEADKLVAIKSDFQVDTLLYSNEHMTKINTYLLDGGDFIVENYGALLKSIAIENYIDRPNPYYLITNRLGFPYFSCIIDNALGNDQDYNKECITDFEIEDAQFGSISGRLNYDFDEMGRVNAIYNSNKPNLKTLIEYQ